MSDYQKVEFPQITAHFKEPFLHIYLLRMDTCIGHVGTVNLLQVSDALKPPDLEPPPTCPFI